jgi:ABC-type Fe3+/spermidine/putrescine transport system ATPase subunit
VTHDQEEALAISDRIAVMRAGRVEQIATPRTIYEHPITAFVASFVGTTNLIDGVICRLDGDTAEIAFAGNTICASGVPGRRAGDCVALSLRPEALRLMARDEAVPAGWVTLAGMLGEIEYLGPVTRFAVELPDGAVIHLMALAPPTASGSVTVAFDPQRVVVMGALA